MLSRFGADQLLAAGVEQVATSRRLQANHKRLEEALVRAIPAASNGRVSQRIAQLQQSLYASYGLKLGTDVNLVLPGSRQRLPSCT